MKKFIEYLLDISPYIFILITAIIVEYNLGWNVGYKSAPTKEQVISNLKYQERADIAITFMCTEHNNWKGAKAFCGSLPLDSDGDNK